MMAGAVPPHRPTPPRYARPRGPLLSPPGEEKKGRRRAKHTSPPGSRLRGPPGAGSGEREGPMAEPWEGEG